MYRIRVSSCLLDVLITPQQHFSGIHNDILTNDILRAGFDAVKPEIVAGGKVDFVNGWHTKFLPVQKSRGPPILRMKRILDTAKSIQLQNTNPLPDNHEVDDDISPKANPHLVGYP